MADAKITELTDIGTVATEDLVPVVDDPGGTPVTKKATVAQVRAAIVPIDLTTDVTGLLPLANLADGAADEVLTTNAAGNAIESRKLVDANVSASAAIALSKTALSANAQTWLATPSSANLRTLVSDETGTGSLVFANTPTLVTPVLGAATATSVAASSFFSTGASPATTGAIRLTDGESIYGRSSSTDYRLLNWNAGLLYIGENGGVANIVTDVTTTHSFAVSGTTQAIIGSTGLRLGSSFRILLAVPAIAADRTLNFPLLTGTDTIAVLDLAQTLTNKTIAAGSNTITGLADANIDAAANIALSKTALSANARTWLGTPSSANLATLVSDETGTAGSLVFSTNPSITGPTITSTTTISSTAIIANGNARCSVYTNIANVQTTDATVTSLYTWTIADEAHTLVTAEVVNCISTGASGAAYVRRTRFERDGGTVATTAVEDSYTNEDTAGWDLTIDNSTSTGRVRVTGAGSTTLDWGGVITRIETTHA